VRWAVVLVVACSSAAPKPPPIENRAPALPAPPPSISMVDQIVRAELEHWLGDPTWLPDGKLLGSTGPILMLRDVEIAHMANDTVTTDMQHIAPSVYIAFDVTLFAGVSDVHVGFAVRELLPSATKGMLLCCCGATDLFASHAGRWTLTKRRGTVCS
jgi:hypothetical protein